MGLLLIAMFVAGAGALVAASRDETPQVETGAEPPSRAALAALVATLVATFAAQLEAIARAAREQVPLPAYLHGMPLLPILDRAPFYGHTSGAAAIAAWACALLETLELVAIAYVLRGRTLRRTDYAIVIAGSLALVVLAFATPGLSSTDIYAYAGYARLGMAAYAPPASAFAAPLRAVNAIWGVPLLPCAYGPLWLASVHAALAPFASLAAQTLALRAIGATSFLAIVAAVVALRPAPLVIVLVALDPALVEQFVSNAHNDGIAIALALGAAIFVRRSPALAIACVVAASLVKLPFLAIAVVAFAREPRLSRRLAYTAASVVATVASSFAFGGIAYARALAFTARAYASQNGTLDMLHLGVAAVALGAVALAVISRRFGWQAAWSFAGFARTLFPWYLAWGLPYAIFSGPRAWIYLASLPLVSNLATTVFADVAARDASLCACVVAAAFAVRAELFGSPRAARVRTAGDDAVAAIAP